MVNWGADVVKFDAQNVLFSMLVASNLAPGGPSSDAGGLGSTRKETLGIQAWISIDCGRISGPPFGRFWQTLHKNCVFLHACLQVTFFKDFGVRIWTSWVPESSILCEGIAKNSFSHMSGL